MPQAAAAAAVAALSAANVILAGSIGAYAVYGTVYVATTVAGSVALNALTQKAPDRPQGQLVQTELSTDAPRRLQIGTRLNGGVLVDWYTKGNINEDNWRIFYLGEGPMGPLNKVYIDGLVVRDTPITHGQTVSLSGKWSRIQVTYYDGSQTSADATLQAENVGFKSTSIGEGCAFVIVKARFHDEILLIPPSMAFESDGAKLYDRRKDGTAGGSGTHRLRDPSTWELSKNPMVALDHYMLGRYWNALEVEPRFGMGEHPDILPYDKFEAQANLNDEAVTLSAGGTQPRYEADGFAFSNQDHKTIITKFCTAMNARPADYGGELAVISGEAKTPALTVFDTDLIEGAPEGYSPKSPYSALVNGIEGRYQDPVGNYQPIDYPRVTNATYQTEDGGDPKYETLNLEFETSAERAQRLAWLYLQRKRRQATLELVLPFKFYQLEDGDWFVRDGIKFSGGKVFEVVGSPILDPMTLTVAISAVEVDPSDTAWSASFANDNIQVPTQPVPVDVLPVPAAVITALYVESGGVRFPAIRVENTLWNADPPSRIDIEFRPKEAPNETGVRAVTEGQRYEHIFPLFPDTVYEVRTRSRMGRFISEWTIWFEVTTPDEFIVPISTASIEAAVGDVLETADAAREDLAELILSMQVRLEDAMANLSDRGRIDGVKVGTKVRSVQQEIVDGDSALAFNLEVLAVRSDENDAAIVEQQTATADALTAEAEKISLITVRVDNAESKIQTVEQSSASGDRALSSQISGLSSRIRSVERGTDGTADVLTGITTDVRRNEQGLTALSQSLDSLAAQVLGSDNSLSGQANTVTGLTARVVAVEGSVSTFSQEVSNLRGEVSGLGASYSAVADALNVIQTAIQSAGGSINIDLSSITTLGAQVEELATGIAANTNSIEANTNEISNLDGTLEARALELSQLTAEVGDRAAELTELGQTVAGLDSTAVEYALRGVAGTNFFEFYAVATDTAPSQIRLSAAQILIEGDVIVNGTLTADKLVSNATTDRGFWSPGGFSLPTGEAWVNVMSGTIPNVNGARVRFEWDGVFSRTQNAGLQWRMVVAGTTYPWKNILGDGPNAEQASGIARFTCPNNAAFILQMRVSPSQSGAQILELEAESLVNKN